LFAIFILYFLLFHTKRVQRYKKEVKSEE